MGIWYRQGTVNVANGATAVTGILTTWNNQVKPGDRFSADGGGKWYEVATVGTDNTSLTLATPFQEATVTGGAYAIDRSSVLWTDAGDIAIKIAALLETQTDVYSGTGAPSPTLGAEGSVYIEFVVSVPSKIYVKGSGGWDAGTSIPGPPGLTGPSYAATSTTSLAIGTGSKAFTTQADRAYLAGTRVRASSAADPDGTWMEGVVDSYATTTLTVLVDLVAGSGSHADWNISLAGERGQTGPVGQAAPFSLDYTWTTSTVGDPTPGKVGINHLTPGSLTGFQINETDRLGNNKAGIIATAGQSTNPKKARIDIIDVLDGTNWISLEVTTSLTDNGSWRNATATPKGSGGTIADAARVTVVITPYGDAGAGISAGMAIAMAIVFG